MCSLTSAEYRGMITFLLMLATLFLIQARMPLAFLSTWARCWLMFSWLSTSTPKSFSAGNFPATPPQACSVAGPKAFGLVEPPTVHYTYSPSIQPFQIPLKSLPTLKYMTLLPNFVLPANLLREHESPSST